MTLENYKTRIRSLFEWLLVSPLLPFFFLYDLWDRYSVSSRAQADKWYAETQRLNTENYHLRRELYLHKKLCKHVKSV
jgi:hypothetical protein